MCPETFSTCFSWYFGCCCCCFVFWSGIRNLLFTPWYWIHKNLAQVFSSSSSVLVSNNSDLLVNLKSTKGHISKLHLILGNVHYLAGNCCYQTTWLKPYQDHRFKVMYNNNISKVYSFERISLTSQVCVRSHLS